MAANQTLVERVRQTLDDCATPFVEKKMFGGVAFMIYGKMCMTVGKDRMMFRIDPSEHAKAVAKKGCQAVVMRGRECAGYVRVSSDSLEMKRVFDHWMHRALDFNVKLAGEGSK